MSHTPGPWELSRHRLEFTVEKDSSQYKGLLCHVELDDYDPETQQANARLIAAAPDLLEELIACRDALEELREHSMTPWGMSADSCNEIMTERIAAAEAVIKKATGE